MWLQQCSERQIQPKTLHTQDDIVTKAMVYVLLFRVME